MHDHLQAVVSVHRVTDQLCRARASLSAPHDKHTYVATVGTGPIDKTRNIIRKHGTAQGNLELTSSGRTAAAEVNQAVAGSSSVQVGNPASGNHSDGMLATQEISLDRVEKTGEQADSEVRVLLEEMDAVRGKV